MKYACPPWNLPLPGHGHKGSDGLYAAVALSVALMLKDGSPCEV